MISRMKLINNYLLKHTIKVILFEYSGSTRHDMRARNLTNLINTTKSNQKLKQVIKTNRKHFNLFNLSALLKKISSKHNVDQQLIKMAYNEVRIHLKQIKQPNQQNTRAIANIIGYTGNLNYYGISSQIKQINLLKLISYANQKQFLMIFTGLLKLDLFQQIFKEQKEGSKQQMLEQLVLQKLGTFTNSGLVISLWKILLKKGSFSNQLLTKVGKKLIILPSTHNLKDFGFLLYCFNQYHKKMHKQIGKPQGQSGVEKQLKEVIRKCSENILYTNRINIFELCIFVDNLVMLKQITKQQISPNSQFIQIIKYDFLRITQEVDELRSLANGYKSFYRLESEGVLTFADDEYYQIYTTILQKFIAMLKDIIHKYKIKTQQNHSRDNNNNNSYQNIELNKIVKHRINNNVNHYSDAKISQIEGQQNSIVQQRKQKINMLNKLQKNIDDMQSVTSLLVQLMTNKPAYDSSQKTRKDYLQQMLNMIKQYVFDVEAKPVRSQSQKGKNTTKKYGIDRMSDKEFQKFLYGLHLYYKQQGSQAILNERQVRMVVQSLIKRKQLIWQHIFSILFIFSQLKIKDNRVCIHLKESINKLMSHKGENKSKNTAINTEKQSNCSQQLQKMKKVLSRPCLLGLHKQNQCLNCLHSQKNKQ